MKTKTKRNGKKRKCYR